MKKGIVVLLMHLCLINVLKSQDSIPEKSKLQIGGYGEVAFTRNFYSDEWQRYTNAENYKDAASHGRFDIPHVVFTVAYDFGNGWSISSEIEFEHGGVGSAVEMEAEETGEYETEVERGGEVNLEQFWIQKSFNKAFNIRIGHIIVPIGLTNQHHLPTEFFTVYRSEGENTIFPCTWHETGASIWGKVSKLRYELQFLPGLDSDRFGSEGFINGSAGSPYEFKIANSYAGALRLDYYMSKKFRMGLSGYYGQCFSNSLTKKTKYKDNKGELFIGAVDFTYKSRILIMRGNFDYAHLTDSKAITRFNKENMSNASPSPKTAVASDALCGSLSMGYNVMSLFTKASYPSLFVFGQYEYYDSMYKTESGIMDYEWCGKHRLAFGLNYFPMKQIVVKAEYSKRFYKPQYNDEPSISFGIAYAGFFTK